jgi:branched-chain amino acid transport system substrate-binding protein
MKRNPWNDSLFGQTRIRADGRAMHRMLFVQVKSPAESKGTYDLLKVKKLVGGDEAFRPESEGKCPLSKS